MSKSKSKTIDTDLAEAAADWTLSNLAVRRDVFGSYTSGGGQCTAHDVLTREILIDHYLGLRTIGLHSTSPDGKCKCITWDIDAHGTEDSAGDNLEEARFIRAVLGESFAVSDPLIFDSNGSGGYHVKLVLKSSIPSVVAHWVGGFVNERLVAKGLGSVEFFPKQAEPSIDHPFGNWVRLPGKHHKRDHWSRLLTLEGLWLDYGDSLSSMVKRPAHDPGSILGRYRALHEADKPTTRTDKRHRSNGDDYPDEPKVRSAIGHLMGRVHADQYGLWLSVGMALHDWDQDRGLGIWKELSASCPDKYDPKACEAKWRSFTAGSGLTIRTPLRWAIDSGWVANGNGAKVNWPVGRIVPLSDPEPITEFVIRADSITPEAVDWLWYGRIAKGFITIFYGRTAIGKSFVALEIAAMVSKGLPWPDCKPHEGNGDASVCKPGNVLLISEDPFSTVLVPRLMAMGADRSRLHFMTWKAMAKWVLEDIELLDRAYRDSGEPTLIVIDPPTNFLGGRDEHKNADVRRALMAIVEWLDTKAKGAACVLCTHVNKSKSQGVDAIFRLIGSVAWGTTARIAHAFDSDPEDKTRCVFACAKSNIGPRPKALGYRIVKHDLPIDGGELIEVAKVEWLGEVNLDADDLMSGERKKPRGVVAVEWLVEKFREQPSWPSKDLFEHAANAGLSRNALFSPEVSALPIVKRQHTRADGSNYWTWTARAGWPPENLPSRAPAPAGETGILGLSGFCPSNSLQDNTYSRVPIFDGDRDSASCRDSGGGQSPEIGGQSPDGRDSGFSLQDKDLSGQSPRIPESRCVVSRAPARVRACEDDDSVAVAMEILMDNLRWGPRRAAAVEEYASSRWGIDAAVLLEAVERFEVVKSLVDGEVYWSLKGGNGG